MAALSNGHRPTLAARGIADHWGVVESTVFRDVGRHIQRIAEESRAKYEIAMAGTIGAEEVEIADQALRRLIHEFLDAFVVAWLHAIEGETIEERIKELGYQVTEAYLSILAEEVRKNSDIPAWLAEAFIDGLAGRRPQE
jgi:hypothetical protein